MKKIIFLSVLLFFISSCNPFTASPEKTITKYLDNYYRGNYKASYSLLSADDKKFEKEEEYEQSLNDNFLFKMFSNKISYSIKEVNVNGDKAEAVIDITRPDFSKVATDLVGIMFSSILSEEKNQKEIEDKIAEKLKGKTIPMTTETQVFELVKDQDGWKVFLNLEGQKQAQELVKQASQLESDKKFEEAKIKYQEAYSLYKSDTTVQRKLTEIDKEINIYKTKKAYFDKIIIRNVHLSTDILNTIDVVGEIKNTGDKTLNQVEITAYCLDKNDSTVFEKSYDPVLVMEYSFSDNNEPLKPNYSRRFSFGLDNAPSDWNKKVKVVVSDIEFQ